MVTVLMEALLNYYKVLEMIYSSTEVRYMVLGCNYCQSCLVDYDVNISGDQRCKVKYLIQKSGSLHYDTK